MFAQRFALAQAKGGAPASPSPSKSVIGGKRRADGISSTFAGDDELGEAQGVRARAVVVVVVVVLVVVVNVSSDCRRGNKTTGRLVVCGSFCGRFCVRVLCTSGLVCCGMYLPFFLLDLVGSVLLYLFCFCFFLSVVFCWTFLVCSSCR